jgi:hypothetical protein
MSLCISVGAAADFGTFLHLVVAFLDVARLEIVEVVVAF